MPVTIDRNFILREVRHIFLFILASLIQGYLMCPRCNSVKDYTFIMSFTFLMWFFLWKGNSMVSSALSKRWPWMEFPTQRLVIGIAGTVAYTVGIMVVIMTIYEVVFGFNFGKGYIYTIYGAVVITILISLFLHGRAFFSFWKQATIEKEQYMRESISAKYESLKNQVNPHFLFNSLNALTNLVYEDPDKAVKFIKQLSDVYRYVLDTRDREVVSLAEELKFLRSYLYLQQIRCGDKLKVTIQLNDLDVQVVPLALQMLVENSIKHNVVSEEEPLSLSVTMDDRYVTVQNDLQPKQSLGEPSAGVGLENIQRRYGLLTDKKVIIDTQDKKFTVRLPLIRNADKLFTNNGSVAVTHADEGTNQSCKP